MAYREPIKIAIVGNCQVRPLAELLSHHSAVHNDISQIIVHLSNEASAVDHDQLLDDADLILCQLVADNYPVKHVQTERIKARFPDKVVVWPNLFFHGQNPDLVYATGQDNHRIVGPIDVYHSRSLIELWKQNVDPNDINVQNYISSVFSNDVVIEQVEKSFSDLALRELKTDIKMSAFIRNNWKSKKLFHTFNHPTSLTLKALAIQIFTHIGIEDELSASTHEFNDWLGTIRPPFEQKMGDVLGLEYEVCSNIEGVELDEKQVSVIPGKYQPYTFAEFVRASYSCYNAQQPLMGEIRFTPAMST